MESKTWDVLKEAESVSFVWLNDDLWRTVVLIVLVDAFCLIRYESWPSVDMPLIKSEIDKLSNR